MARFLMCGILVVCAFGLHSAGQQQPIFRGASDVVRVFVTVMDRDGRLVTTLTRDNFEIRDEGKPQPITQFDNSPQPIRLIVMLDVSGSMEGNLPLLRAAGVQLFSRLRIDDVARVGAFGHEITISPSFTHNPDESRAALPTAIAPDAPTPLWRALDQAIGAFGDADDARKVILVLSDGKDTGTGTLNFRESPSSQVEVIDRARGADVMIYAIGMRSRSTQPMRPESDRLAFRPCCWRTCLTLAWCASPRRLAAATLKFASARISPPPLRELPMSSTPNICSALPLPNVTAKFTTSTCS